VLFAEFSLLLMVSWWSRCAEQWHRIERPYALPIFRWLREWSSEGGL